VRAVLDAPRGQRFTRTRTRAGSRPPTREEHLLAQMQGNPRVARRVQQGELPLWMEIADQRRTGRNTGGRPQPGTPLPPIPRPRPRPRSHRKPRHRLRWTLTGYTLAALAGAVAHHLTTVFL
jgi:hypothetical protein